MESLEKNEAVVTKDAFLAHVKQLLEVDAIAEIDSFFEMGLDSIRLIRFIHHVNTQYDLTLTIVDLYESENVGAFYDRCFPKN